DPDGTVTNVKYGPDPRFGMLAPMAISATVTTPGGTTRTESETRTVTLSDPSNPLSAVTLTETQTINGQSYINRFDAAARTITWITPAGRTRVDTLDAAGRVIKMQTDGLDPLELDYDAHGRLRAVVQGQRALTVTYDAQGNVATVSDALQHTDQLAFDAAG